MKITLAVLLGCLSLFMSHLSLADCSDGYNCLSVDQNPCNNGDCECADPACRQDNPCLSASKCCEVFGNIGRI